MLPLPDAIPPIRGGVGRPWRRPQTLFADRGYDHRPQRRAVSRRSIRIRIVRRRTASGSGLGRYRWPVEQTFALLHRFRRLATCYERTIETHAAFVALACCLICWRRLRTDFSSTGDHPTRSAAPQAAGRPTARPPDLLQALAEQARESQLRPPLHSQFMPHTGPS
jgi:transposase